jgi:hypothetical protein
MDGGKVSAVSSFWIEKGADRSFSTARFVRRRRSTERAARGDAPESFGAAGDDGALAVEVERRALADHIVPKGPLT